MNCDNTYCVYQKNGTCLLDSISIDSTGQCADCIKIYISQDTLNSLKREHLFELFNRYEK